MSESQHSKTKTPLLGDKAYSALKSLATIGLPAVGALYFALAQIWGLPEPEKVVGTIASVNTFVGVLLGVSSRSYNNSNVMYDGTITLEDSGNGKMASIQLHHDTEAELTKKNIAVFKVDGK